MALQLSKTLSNDATGNYWKIIKVSDDRKHARAEVSIGLFASVASKEKLPLEVFGYFFDAHGNAPYPFSIAALVGTNHVAVTYNLLKTLPEFEGATDV